MALKLTICIVSWNTRDLLQDCLASVYASGAGFAYEVTVVDNHSTDGSADAVAEHFPQARLIRNPGNPGFAAANNQAIKISTAPYVLLLNPDTVIPSDLLQGLVDFMDATPNAGAAGPKLVFPDGSIQDSFAFCLPSLRMILIHHGLLAGPDAGLQPRTGPFLVAGVMGACLVLRRAAIDQVGQMDERFFLVFEEAELCFRLQKKGWLVYYLPQIEVIHYQGQSEQQVPGIGLIETQVSLLLYLQKHYGLAIAVMGALLTIGIRTWWWGRTAIKSLLYGRTAETAARQMENRYFIIGQCRGIMKLLKRIVG